MNWIFSIFYTEPFFAVSTNSVSLTLFDISWVNLLLPFVAVWVLSLIMFFFLEIAVLCANYFNTKHQFLNTTIIPTLIKLQKINNINFLIYSLFFVTLL